MTDTQPADETEQSGPGEPGPWARADHAWLALILVATLYLYLVGIGSYSLWDPWEPKYAGAMQEMMERGDLITPYFNDKVRWTKPILFYWAMYVPMALWGNNEFSARLPSALAATLGVLLTFHFLRLLRGRRTAVIGAAVLATTPMYFYLARQAMPDMLLTLFVTATMGWFALGRFGRNRNKLFFLLSYGALGLAFLTKGPVGVLMPLGALILFWSLDLGAAWSAGPGLATVKSTLRSYHLGTGLAIFVLVTAPWYTAMLVKHGYAFVDNFFVSENLERFQEPVRDHHGTAEHYVRDLFHGMYPWSGLLPVSLLFLFYGHRRLDEKLRQKWYYVCWGLSVFGLFSVSGSKLDHYILPMVPAVAVLVALVWESYFKDEAAFWVRPAFLASFVFVLIPIRDFLIEGNRYVFGVFVTNARTIEAAHLELALKAVLAAWAVVVLWTVLVRRSVIPAVLAVVVAYGQAVYLTHDVLPRHTPARSMKPYVDAYREMRGPQADLVLYGRIQYTLHYYQGRRNYRYIEGGRLNELIRYVNDRPEVFVIAPADRASGLAVRLRTRTGGRWDIVADGHPDYVMLSRVPPEAPVR